MRIFPAFALLSVLALPAAAHAATFAFSAVGSASGFNGSGTFGATDNGNGSFTITSISGTGINGLIAPGGFQGNDNLLFPTSTSLVDSKGFAFTDTMGNTSFMVDISATGAGVYQAYFLDNDGFSAAPPVTFTLNNTTIPEPSSLFLLGTGILGIAGPVRRRLFA